MSENKWTTEQYSAITAATGNLLIAAAAGAGKTAVLIERITRKITALQNPVDIDKLLVVTFTKAAASQMRERLGKAINKLLEEQPESKEMQRQLTLLGKASITTIHSFCLEVIHSNFHTVELDPGFRIADETEALLFKLEAMEELFESRYEEENYDPSFFKLLDSFGGGRDDRALQDIVLGVYNFIQSNPWPMEWMESSVQALNLADCKDFGMTKYARILKDTIRIELQSLLLQMQEALDIVNTAEGLTPYSEAFTQDLSSLQLLIKHCSEQSTWDDLYNAFRDIEHLKLKNCSKNADTEKKELVKGIRDNVKKRLKILADTVVYADSEEVSKELTYLYPMFDCLYRLVRDFDQVYKSKKKKKGLIDFNDLEHYCLQILTNKAEDGSIVPSEAAITYRNRFEEIYIDEYQDSNEVQEVILNMISRGPVNQPNIFMVGDVKQSIYRFRQAKPELFKHKYDTYLSEEGSVMRKILLNKNFRSRKEILDAANFVFRLLMSETVGELDYNDNEALNPGASYKEIKEEPIEAGGPIELNIIDMSSSAEVPDEEPEEDEEGLPQLEDQEDMDAVRCEAAAAGDKIKSLLDRRREKPFMVYDEGEQSYRPLKYSDIVILMRSTKNWVDVFVEELTKRDIPVYADTGSGYLKTTEISTMISLLQIIDNPLQDIPLLAVLNSPVGDFNGEELIDIRAADKESTLFEAMQELAGMEEEASAKCKHFLSRLENWRSKAEQLSTAELIWYLFNDTGYFSYASAMPGGLQRQANLKLLFEKARQFEDTSLKGLFNFVNFIDKLKGSSGDMGGAKILGENANVVRIMSIHKSKGLEFPVVILAGTGKGFNLMDMNKSILLHQDLGLGPDYVDYERRISYATAAKQALRYKIKLESLSEEMRILYVAFTRAKEKLIILGTVNNINRAAARWRCRLDKNEQYGTNSLKLSSYDILRSKNYLDWICSALYLHPDGELLRAINNDGCGCHTMLTEDVSRWKVKVISKQEILSSGLQEAKQDFMSEFSLMEKEPNGQYSPDKDEIVRRLQWEYPYKLMNTLPVKITVSELKRRFDSSISEEGANLYIPPLVQKPRFMEESKTMSAAEKGTIMHFVMQHLDLKTAGTEEGIRLQLGHMLQTELLTEEQVRTVKTDRLLRLINSDLGRRMTHAKLYREIPFNMEISCTKLYKNLDPDKYGHHMVMLQGVIDCYFEEADSLVLLDYKTDYVNNNTDAIKERYQVQIDFYTKALENITGKRVAERYIYLFYNGEILEM